MFTVSPRAVKSLTWPEPYPADVGRAGVDSYPQFQPRLSATSIAYGLHELMGC